jgi:DNA polymerase V
VNTIDLLTHPYKNFVNNKFSINLLSILVNKKYFFMDGDRFYRSASGGAKNSSHWDSPVPIGANEDHGCRGFDLNEQLIRNKPTTFFLRVSGEAMVHAGIFNGDILIVDRSLKAVNGKIVVALLNGEMLVRRLEKTFNRIRLIPETDRLSVIEVDTSSCEFSIWGVVTYVIHSV